MHVLAWQKAYRGLMPDDFLDGFSIEARGRGWRKNLEEGSAEGGRTWVALSDGEVAGFVVVGASRDADAGADVGEVHAINLDPARWRMGIGSALLERGVEELRAAGFAGATLWVLEGNERARRFYERRGWLPDGAAKEDDRGSFVLREVRYRIEFV